MLRTAILLSAAALVLVPAIAGAQTPTRRRQQAIEIRGQVPTPQVVTVRPREVPAYSRQVISPAFYDRSFWPSILPGYQLVPQRMITGTAPMDSGLVRDTPGGAGTAAQPMTLRPPPGTPPAANLRTAPAPATGATPADSSRTIRPDSTRTVPPDPATSPGTSRAPARR